VRAILPNYGWNICFLILSVKNFHHALGGAAGANWLLSKAGVFPECPGNPRFELQIVVPGHGDLDIFIWFLKGEGTLGKVDPVFYYLIN
jgi:hypothetical protein